MISDTKAAAIPAGWFVLVVPLSKVPLKAASSWLRSNRKGAELELVEGLARKESIRRVKTDKHNCR